MKHIIETHHAPTAIGCYSQGIQIGNVVYLSGQIPLDPSSMHMVEGDITKQLIQIFENLKCVSGAAGGSLDAIVKLTVYLTDINYLSEVNTVMARYFNPPYPARTSIAVLGLPKGAKAEVDAIMVL